MQHISTKQESQRGKTKLELQEHQLENIICQTLTNCGSGEEHWSPVETQTQTDT